jgi:translation initiation factor IF-2
VGKVSRKKRVYELARELRIDTPELINTLHELNYTQYNHRLNSLENEIVEEVRNFYKEKNIKEAEEILEAENKKEEVVEEIEEEEIYILLPEKIGIKELSEKIEIPRMELINKLMGMGVMNVSQKLDFETVAILCDELGINVKLESSEKSGVSEKEDISKKPKIIDSKNLVEKPPVVTVMGHVDHGKTTLLDAIRKTKVASSEAGGITQHIGAYQVEINGKKITFLDTPGHEAFTSMRAHGAQITDIVVLIVAADDGVQPQTVEAIDHAISAEVPIIVAVNKIDKDNANIDRVKEQLSKLGLIPEDWGGDTIFVEISAKNNLNIDSLLEMVLLQAEMMELKADPTVKPEGVVIESYLDKGRGPVATILVQNGTLKKGDSIVIGTTYGRIRSIVNDKGKQLKKAGPSTPVEIFGLNDVPEVGEKLLWAKNDKEARKIAQENERVRKEKEQKESRLSLKDLYQQLNELEVDELNILLKADVQGSIPALKNVLEKCSTENIKVRIIRSGVGAVTDSDVMLAVASNAIIIGFNVRATSSAKKLSEKEKVDMNFFSVIYDLVDSVKAAIKGMETPELREVITGKAEVRATFKVPKVGVVAGCYVTEGTIFRNNMARLIREGEVVFEGRISSLKRFKEDVRQVESGYECGLGLEKWNDVKEGDIIESYQMKEEDMEEVNG